MKKIVLSLTAIISASFLFSQEALKSTEEEYYDFLSLQGIVERPTLGYRTLSDSEWKFIEKEVDVVDEDGNPLTDEAGNKLTNLVMPDHPWQKNNLGTKRTLWQGQEGTNWFTRGFDHSLKLKIYGPEWYNSYNTAAPYGQNDGALWQGKGYNSSLTGGARLEAYGFEVTLKPQVVFSQNNFFEITNNSEYYTNKYAYTWGYGNNIGADAPQRFGDSAFWTYDWGDTEIRWTWNTFTIGLGTQSPWVGPSQINSILHSNNAPTYPKFDIGIRKTEIYMPFFGWDLGALEGRLWTGYLSESDYFDNDSTNNHNMLHGLSMSFSPSFIPGLTIGLNRVCMVKWKLSNLKYIIPTTNNTYIGDSSGNGEDQKMTIFLDWNFPKIGFNVYGELGMDDGTPFQHYLRTAVYTVGLKKTILISKKHNIIGELILEWTNTEMTQDFQFQYKYSFGFHHQITQGYTNKGQWIGIGQGYGGENRFLGFKVYYPLGFLMFYYQIENIDSNYIYSKAVYSKASDNVLNGTWPIKYYRTTGLSNGNYINKNIFLSETIGYNDIHHFRYGNDQDLHNFFFNLKLKYNF